MRSVDLTDDEAKETNNLGLLTAKKVYLLRKRKWYYSYPVRASHTVQIQYNLSVVMAGCQNVSWVRNKYRFFSFFSLA